MYYIFNVTSIYAQNVTLCKLLNANSFPVDCDSSPCLNGGTCVPGFETGYYCKCPDGYYEYHCEKREFKH